MKRYFIRSFAILCLCVSLLLSFPLLHLSVFAEETGNDPVSYGLNVLAARTDMAMSEMAGNDVVFSEEDFARALNLSKVHYITVKSLPETAAGELLLGSTRVAAGQTISAENLANLSFSPAIEGEVQASFLFSANGNPTAMVCKLYLLNAPNSTPSVSIASGISLNASTYRDITLHGRISAYDPDGDAMTFEIVSYPQNGSVLFSDARLGTYVYAPEKGYTGTDQFSYVARDQYGNYSAAATVELKIAAVGSAVTYADMQNSKYEKAALSLTEAGVMSGNQMGNQYYFYPESTVSRLDFLVMAMNAAGITDIPKAEASAFADNAEIPQNLRGYVAAALELGYITGTLENGNLCFLPNDNITLSEAAVMLDRILDPQDAVVIPVFADAKDIPAWAGGAIYSLNAAGILTTFSESISPMSDITRAEAAQILCAVMEYCK